MTKRTVHALLLVVTFTVVLGGILFLVASPPSSFAQAEPDMAPNGFDIRWDVVANGGSTMHSSSYIMQSTIGQNAVVAMHSAHYKVNNGYWTGMWERLKRIFLPLYRR